MGGWVGVLCVGVGVGVGVGGWVGGCVCVSWFEASNMHTTYKYGLTSYTIASGLIH